MPEPTWASEDGQVQLYLGDCLAVLPTLAAGSVDAVVTDPPYGVDFKYQGAYSDGRDEYWDWFPLALSEMRRIASLVIFTQGGGLEAIRRLSGWDWIGVWHKPFKPGGPRFGWFPHWEPIFVYGRPCKPRSDVFAFNTQKPNGHPCPKPLELYKELLQLVDTGATVLDPFMGSGTTGVACVQTGRRFIGIEIEEKYFTIAVKRIQEAKMQLRMELS